MQRTALERVSRICTCVHDRHQVNEAGVLVVPRAPTAALQLRTTVVAVRQQLFTYPIALEAGVCVGGVGHCWQRMRVAVTV